MPAIVTKDIQRARRIVCDGYESARYTKRKAHRRQRARSRRLVRVGALELQVYEERLEWDIGVADLRCRPGTGWDVA